MRLAHLAILDQSERETLRRLSETTDFAERYEHNVKLENIRELLADTKKGDRS